MPRTPRQKLPTAKPKHIEPWPEGQRSPEEVADEAIYVGSPEHKHYTNPVNDETPAPRGVSSPTRLRRLSRRDVVPLHRAAPRGDPASLHERGL